jgi:hypothetical protein
MIHRKDNCMVSSAIWKKHSRVSFSKTIKIVRVSLKNSLECMFFSNFFQKKRNLKKSTILTFFKQKRALPVYKMPPLV